MIKATKPKGVLEPFNTGTQTRKNMLVYIGNIYNTENEDKWMKAGTELRIFDLFRRVLVTKRQPPNRGGGHSGVLRVAHVTPKRRTQHQPTQYHTLLRKGVERGDAFVVFGSGAAYVIRKRRDGEGYWLTKATKEERKLVFKGEFTARRNLRWARGSFCYKQPTKDWLANQ